MGSAERLRELYTILLDHFGPQHWWPGETPFEVLTGAVLTQNTNWKNVEKAIGRLKAAGVLSLKAMSALPTEVLAEYIRPSGYYNIKAARLQNLLTMINSEHEGNLAYFFDQPLDALRHQLLSVKGIGPETADSIVLYGAGLPVFVIDAYTHRVLFRHGLATEDDGYAELQSLFMDSLESDAGLFNEYHALLVQVGKTYCKKTNPACQTCPLQGF